MRGVYRVRKQEGRNGCTNALGAGLVEIGDGKRGTRDAICKRVGKKRDS